MVAVTGGAPAAPTTMPLRVRAWGWFMNRFRSMHIATMSPGDITHNQTMQHVPAPVRRLLFGARDPRVTTDDRTIPPAPGSSTGIPIRIYRPRTAEPAHLPTAGAPPLPIAMYLHGGGWTLFGALDMCDWLPSRVAAQLGAVVVAVDYRLAPEHPFPAAVDDSLAALAWVADHAAELGADPARLSVFGDSAGGNLAAVLSILARDANRASTAPSHGGDTAPAPPSAHGDSPDSGGPARSLPRIAAQALIYPVTDTVLDDASMRSNARSPVLHQADMVAFLDYYLGAERDAPARTDARAAPLRAATLANLPPALVQLGGHDVLHDQGLAYARRLAGDGTDVTLIDYPEAPHGWVTYPTIIRVATRAADDLVSFLRLNLG
ncbi:alpha/beta hydrolase [Subtercola sp. YIM 133946]|uniref:alpha/beta hydrolase n=1 Tax=Subtercola sp. YIM 133946 TaxID=3118909 RepID=UPI002F9220DB